MKSIIIFLIGIGVGVLLIFCYQILDNLRDNNTLNFEDTSVVKKLPANWYKATVIVNMMTEMGLHGVEITKDGEINYSRPKGGGISTSAKNIEFQHIAKEINRFATTLIDSVEWDNKDKNPKIGEIEFTIFTTKGKFKKICQFTELINPQHQLFSLYSRILEICRLLNEIYEERKEEISKL